MRGVLRNDALIFIIPMSTGRSKNIDVSISSRNWCGVVNHRLICVRGVLGTPLPTNGSTTLQVSSFDREKRKLESSSEPQSAGCDGRSVTPNSHSPATYSRPFICDIFSALNSFPCKNVLLTFLEFDYNRYSLSPSSHGPITDFHSWDHKSLTSGYSRQHSIRFNPYSRS